MNRILYLLILLMLCFPQSLMGVKALCLGILLFRFVFKKYRSKYNVYLKKYTQWFVFYFISGFVALFWGELRGNPGTHHYYYIYLVWSLVFPIIFTRLRYDSFKVLVKIFEFSYIVIFFTGIITFVKTNLGVLPFFPQKLFGYELEESARPMFLVVSVAGPALTQFFLLYCFLFSYYCLDNKKIGIKEWLLIVLGMFFIILSSRRIMIMGLLYIPIIVIISSIYVKLGYKQGRLVRQKLFSLYIVPIVVSIFGLGYIFLDSEDAILFFSSAFSSDGDLGMAENARLDQYTALMKGWYENFFMGAGTGVDASISRSNIPGTYELSYFAILFERGLIGGIFYFLLLLLPIIWALHLVRICQNWGTKRLLLSFNTCYISLLIAYATNPYLAAFDFMWIIFIYVVVINIVDKKNLYEKKNLCNNPSL